MNGPPLPVAGSRAKAGLRRGLSRVIVTIAATALLAGCMPLYVGGKVVGTAAKATSGTIGLIL
jgi:hypothetical protein